MAILRSKKATDITVFVILLLIGLSLIVPYQQAEAKSCVAASW